MINYKGNRFYGDTLRIQLAATDLHKPGFDVVCRVKSQHDKVARAKTGMLCFDHTTRKLRPLPEAVAKRLLASADE